MSTHQTQQVLKRILITLSLGLAFIVMASIFSPDRSRASGDGTAPRGSRNRQQPASSESANAHQGLNSLGVIETGRYDIAVYATDAGPRYTIIARETGDEIGTLLTAEQVQLLLPEIDLKTLDFSASEGKTEQLMLADPEE